MMLDDDYFMRAALAEAKEAYAIDEVPIGAVIVANGKIIARGHNQVEKLNDVTAHAEMIAFTSAANSLGGKFLNDCILYVTLEPCPMCAGGAHEIASEKSYLVPLMRKEVISYLRAKSRYSTLLPK